MIPLFKISVLIPTYNCSQYIREAIDSVLTQNYDNLEIIVVDDGSTDNTKEVLKDYPANLKYFYKGNGGIGSTRNACLEHASGELVAWVDSDDYWLPGKLQAQLTYLEEHPDCEIVFTKFENFFEREELEIVSRMMVSGINVNHCIKDVYYRRRLHGINSIITMDYSARNLIYPSVARNFRKNILKK
jgi:glycosyltransferase involved in cell wall biosynthesis